MSDLEAAMNADRLNEIRAEVEFAGSKRTHPWPTHAAMLRDLLAALDAAEHERDELEERWRGMRDCYDREVLRAGKAERRAHERDYIERTIATVRNHKDADNCWPQWANIFADEIEACWAALDAAEQQARLNAQGYPHGISWLEHEGRWSLELHRDGWDIEIEFGGDEPPAIWIVPHGKPDEPVYDSEQAERRAVQAEQELKALHEAFYHSELVWQDRAEAAEARTTQFEIALRQIAERKMPRTFGAGIHAARGIACAVLADLAAEEDK